MSALRFSLRGRCEHCHRADVELFRYNNIESHRMCAVCRDEGEREAYEQAFVEQPCLADVAAGCEP